MKLYNTLTRQVEDFKPQDPNEVKIYTCGPTVYNFQHIGNYAAYIYWDLLIRTIKQNGWSPKRVLNLTDVGHLSSDQDEGEDKMEKGAKREGKTVWEVAEFYANDFLDNFRKLNLLEPEKIARATDYIKANIDLIDVLLEKCYAYVINDGIYFDTAKFAKYPDFAKLDLEHLKAGARINFNSEKRNVSDFALWKFILPGEDHAMQWEYQGRMGYPGWHIECTSIIHEELGETIDIHTGGIDHIPVHHTNEIAQSESAFDIEMSKFWLHCNFITVENEKISKSLGNVYTLQDLADKGFSPLDFKMWALSGHYQTLRNFSFVELESAKMRRLNWRNKIAKLYQSSSEVSISSEFREAIMRALNNNLSSPQALSTIDSYGELALKDWQFVDEVLGLDLINTAPNIDVGIKDLIKQREIARKEKQWDKSDAIREQLALKNIAILDTAEGPIWQYLK